MHKLLLMAVFAVILAGCALGPDYVRPAVETPQAWRYDVEGVKDLANTPWWQQFGDPVLNDLISTSLKENQDLKIAAARVSEYEGRFMVTRSDLFPKADASYSAARNRITEHNPMISSLITNPYNQYQAGFGASWELDIWGRYRRADEAARADLLATEEARQGVILSLCSSVAVGYINLRDLDNQLDIARRTVQNTKGTLDLFVIREEGGVISDLELSQVKSQYALALSKIPAIEKLIFQQEDALCVLVGRNPGPIGRGKTIDELALPMIPQGLPSDLLERRPDVRQAEQSLISANAHIGEARALYFPSISLTGAFGWTSNHLSDLIKSSSKVWNYSGAVNAPIFQGGAIRGQNKVAEAVQQEALFSYLNTVKGAFKEVNDSLMNQKYSRDQLAAQKMQVEALRDYARYARSRFDDGYTSYIEVLDAENSLFEAELSYAQTKGTLFADLVGIYKAMGGGWVVEADKIASQSPPADKNGKDEKSGKK